MSYKQIFTEEEHPIFEFRNVSLNNVMNIIGDLKSFHPRQIIFNEYDSINTIIECAKLVSDCMFTVFLSDVEAVDMSCMPSNLVIYRIIDDNFLESLSEVDLNEKLVGSIVSIDVNNVQIVLELLTKNCFKKQVVLKPIVFGEKGIGMRLMQMLYHTINQYNQNRSSKILMYYHIFPRAFLIKHPCNAYVLSECNCHTKKNNYPRHIVINQNGELYPYDEEVGSKYYIGNIGGCLYDTLIKYNCSNEHERFLSVCKRVFVNHVTASPFSVVPWGELFVKYAKEDK